MMDNVIKNSLKKAQSYSKYKEMILSLLEQDNTTGNIQNEDLCNFTKLNEKRMKRLDKQTKLSERAEQKVRKIQKDFTWLMLTESWCGDAAQTLPVINKFSEANPKIELKVVLRGDNDDLMKQFLTNGSKSIPKLIIIEKDTNKVLSSWGPRSKKASILVTDYKNKQGKIDEEFKKNLQYWYNKDKGRSIENDMIEFLDKMM